MSTWTLTEAAEVLGLEPQALRTAKARRRLRAYRKDGEWVADWHAIRGYADWAGLTIIVGYHAVHARVRRSRSHVSTYTCAHCGTTAAQWAYDHADPNELWEGTQVYSMDLDRYIPLCRSCHKKFDIPYTRQAQ